MVDEFREDIFVELVINAYEFANDCFVKGGRCFQEVHNRLNMGIVLLLWIWDDFALGEESYAILRLEVELGSRVVDENLLCSLSLQPLKLLMFR